MNSAIGYIFNMIPYMVISIPIYIIIRFIIFIVKKLKVNWYHEIVLLSYS